MLQKRKKGFLIGINFLCFFILALLAFFRGSWNEKDKAVNKSTYFSLPADESKEDPLLYMDSDFTVKEGFHSNLPIVLLTIDGELPDYKEFSDGQEYVINEEPWTTGYISIIDNGKFNNSIGDTPVMESHLKIKKRGHTSYLYDKSQYLIKLQNENGTDNKADILGMGEDESWILNGSMADKSMIRNYISYRISSEIMNTTPDCQYCEVIMKDGDRYIYQGLYLMMETVSRGINRVNIDQFKEKNIYTSYIVRRDRFTNFDVMLNTFGRLEGLSEEWIGIKYPSEAKLTEKAKQYIESDFSRTEEIIYSEDERVFKIYDKYIDIDSFADYFLINEFFGNYDAGEHSTYMYKNSGERLKIGPVWDFDQAINNYFQEEMEPETLAFQERQFFKQLSKDERFVKLLQSRYSQLRQNALKEEHVNAVIDEAAAYIKSARQREWSRWAKDYEDDSGNNPHNYYLQSYEMDDMIVSRFNDNYDQEIYNIKVYLHKHGRAISTELIKLQKMTTVDTSLKSENGLFLLVIMVLFLIPSISLIRKG